MDDLILVLTVAAMLTVAIELCVLWLLRERRAKVFAASVAMNLLTNIALNTFLYWAEDGIFLVLACELLIVAVEAILYYPVTHDKMQSLIYSALCNGVSFSLGVLLLLWWDS